MISPIEFAACFDITYTSSFHKKFFTGVFLRNQKRLRLKKLPRFDYYALTLQVSTPRNDQTHSNNFSATVGEKYGPEITPYLDTFHAVDLLKNS